MGRSKRALGKQRRAPRTTIGMPLPETKEQLCAVMRVAAKPPANLRLPTYDQAAEVRRWATDHGFGFVDATRLLGRRHNEDPAPTLELLEALGQKAIKDPRTVYFLGATAENVEASAFVAFVAQMALSGHVAASHCFQSYTWRGDDWFAAYEPMSPQELRNGLAPLAPDWQCCVCLADTCETDGTVPMWECVHAVCRECAMKDDQQMGRSRIPCPLCRAKMSAPLVVGDVVML